MQHYNLDVSLSLKHASLNRYMQILQSLPSPDKSLASPAGKFAPAAAASQSKWDDELAVQLEAEFPTSQGSRSKAQRLKDVWTAMFPHAGSEVISSSSCKDRSYFALL